MKLMAKHVQKYLVTCDKQPNNYVLIGFTFVSKGAIMPLLASY